LLFFLFCDSKVQKLAVPELVPQPLPKLCKRAAIFYAQRIVLHKEKAILFKYWTSKKKSLADIFSSSVVGSVTRRFVKKMRPILSKYRPKWCLTK
jgi:hypothetical protein